MITGSFWISAGRAAANVIGFVSTVVLARLLAPADFGIVALGTTVLAIVSAVTEMSLAQALVHHREPSDEHFHTAWTLNFGRAVLLSLAIAAAARPLAKFYEEPRLEPLLYALTISVLVGGMRNPRIVMLSRQLVFWQDFLLGVAEKIASFAVAVAAAFYFRSFWALVLGAIAGQMASVILSYVIMPYRPRIVVRHARELWSFSVWLTLSQAMNTINWRFDQLLIGHFLGRTALGFYSVGDNLAQMATREATRPLTSTLFPAFASIAGEPDRLRAGYQRAQRLATAIALPVGIGFAFCAKPFVVAAMGAKWLPAVPLVQALSAVFALQTLGTLAQPLGLATGQTKLLFRRDVQIFFVRLPIITAGMITWGLPGLIYSRIFTGLFGAAVNMLMVRQMIGLTVSTQLKANLRSLVAVAVMAAGLLALSLLGPRTHEDLASIVSELVVIVGVGALLYLGTTSTLWLLGGRPDGPEREVLHLVARVLKKVAASPTAA
jgi:O-antigen/teichoic acid export membrane protein